MEIWETLGIKKTTNKREIKRAYAKLAAIYHPEESPEEFKAIYAAYEQAMAYAKGENGNWNQSQLDSEEMNVSFFLKNETADASLNFEQMILPEKKENLSLVNEKNELDFDQLISPDAGTPISLKKEQEKSKIEFGVLNNETEWTDYLDEIDELIGKFRKLAYSSHRNQRKRWNKLLNSEAFLEVRATREFLMKFTIIFRDVQVSKRVARLVFACLDFNDIEESLDDSVYGELKELLIMDIEGKEREVKVILWSDLGKNILQVLFSILIVAFIVFARIEWFDRIIGKIDSYGDASTEERIAYLLEKDYDTEFEVEPIEMPDDIMEIYYLIQEGKEGQDYQWFQASTMYEGIPVTFYISWADNEYHYNYSYKQLFAILSETGLSGYVDDMDKYNLTYYENGEKRYSYPVLLVNGTLNDDFYNKLNRAVELIQSSDVLFEKRDDIVLNFKKVQTGEIYKLRIRKKDSMDMEYIKTELDAFIGEAY